MERYTVKSEYATETFVLEMVAIERIESDINLYRRARSEGFKNAF